MKSLITTGVLAVSLALAGNAAMAATTQVRKPVKTVHVSHARPAAHVAARKPQPRAQLNVDIAQFVQGMLSGGPVPYANLIRDVQRMPASRGSPGSSYSPSYDYSTATDESSAARDSQAAADAENQAIQSMNDTN